MAATIQSKVLQVLGDTQISTLSSINSPEEVFSEGLWDIATALPRRLLMSYNYAIQPKDVTDLGGSGVETPGEIDIENQIVLLCLRVKADHTVVDNVITQEKYLTRTCKSIPFESSYQALDSDSIYFSTDYSPVYYLEPQEANKLKLKTAPVTTGHTTSSVNETLPANKSGLRVWLYTRQEFTSVDYQTVTEFTQIPPEAEPVCVRAIALRFLDEYISKSTFEDEDQEIAALLSQQKQLLDQEIKSMLDKLKVDWEG